MNKWILPLLLIPLVLGYWLAPKYLSQDSGIDLFMVPESCQFGAEDCEVLLPGGAALAISVGGSVKPLSTFAISIRSADLQAVSVSFEMVDMDMGINRYRFAESADGQWDASVMLPICTTGRVDWLAWFDLKLKDGQRYRLEYPFTAEGNPAPK